MLEKLAFLYHHHKAYGTSVIGFFKELYEAYKLPEQLLKEAQLIEEVVENLEDE